MVYGTYADSEKTRVETLLADFVKLGLKGGFRFITRNGAAADAKGQWPGNTANEHPVDNIVIDTIAQNRSATDIPKRLTTYITPNRTEYRAVGQTALQCPARRFEMYSLFLDKVDCFVFVGGDNGVLRLGLLCHFLKKPFVVVGSSGKGTAELADSYYVIDSHMHYQNLRQQDCLALGGPALAGRELHRIVKQNVRWPLSFALTETLRRRMRIGRLLEMLWESLEHHLGVVGRTAVFVLVALGILAALRIETGVVWNHAREAYELVEGVFHRRPAELVTPLVDGGGDHP
jgi:hypothetical protein